MGQYIETQDTNELIQIRSRELQLENTEKLNQIIPIAESIQDIDLPNIASDTSEIKNIVQQNLDEQIDLDDINSNINKVNTNLSSLKASVTKLTKTVNVIEKKLEQMEENNG